MNALFATAVEGIDLTSNRFHDSYVLILLYATVYVFLKESQSDARIGRVMNVGTK